MSKTDYIKVTEQRRRRVCVQDDILKGPRPETWSATHKAYSGTTWRPVRVVREVDKAILSQYIGACGLIKEKERDIQKLRQRRKIILRLL